MRSACCTTQDNFPGLSLPPEAEFWGTIDYATALSRMNEAHKARTERAAGDRFFYLEHERVITFGRGTEPSHLRRRPHSIPVLEVARGGQATYHGPGQLVGYLVINLAQRGQGQRPDIHAYLRALEEGLIGFLECEYGLPAGRREGFTGVWTQGFKSTGSAQRKLASIGVAARRWVTLHGFALNIKPAMEDFDAIIPCGITDAEMTSVEREFLRAERSFPELSMKEIAVKAHMHVKRALREAGYCLEAEAAHESLHATEKSFAS